jgi:hypothetical protein
MTDLKIAKAQVISLDDPDNKGKIQIKIIPYMNDVKDADCPWYDPMTGGSNTTFSHNPPTVGSYVVVLPTSSSFRDGYVLFEDFVASYTPDINTKIADLNGVSELSEKDVTKMKFWKLENGNILFLNTSNKDMGIFTKANNGYIILDNSGNLTADVKTGSFTIKNNANEITADSAGNTKLTGNLSITLNTIGASLWQPNILPACLFTGAPHGGTGGGVVGLKGEG